jgi:hypothetical protein
LLALEAEQFMTLVRDPAHRPVEHMLTTGKPLRN